MNKTIIFQYILIFIALIILFNFISILITNRKEKRISDFSLSKSDFDDTTLLEKISHVFWNLIHHISNILTKSNYFRNKALKYEKYIFIKEEKYKSPIDYIAVKIITIMLILILYLLLIFIDILSFNILSLLLFISFALILPDLIWEISYIKKCDKISKKLYESIIIIDDNLSKTNIYNAITKVIESMDENIADEYQRILTDLSYNISIYQAFKRFYERTKIPEIKTIYHLLNVESENLKLVFKRIRMQFECFDKQNNNKNIINNLLNVLKYVYVLIPVLLVLFLLIIDPIYFKNSLNSYLGIVFLQVILVIYVFFVISVKVVTEDKK